MMSQSHFDQHIRDWSARKHAILEEYLPSFCKAVSRRRPPFNFKRTIWYIDAYAGAGIYKDPSDADDLGSHGSPIRAAQITQQLPYDIRCLNVEENLNNF
ncbi:MAG: three-Cys-motif partner protein TcmP, partial [Chloroflexota bacterium]